MSGKAKTRCSHTDVWNPSLSSSWLCFLRLGYVLRKPFTGDNRNPSSYRLTFFQLSNLRGRRSAPLLRVPAPILGLNLIGLAQVQKCSTLNQSLGPGLGFYDWVEVGPSGAHNWNCRSEVTIIPTRAELSMVLVS